MLVRSDAGKNDVVLFSALKGVNGRYFYVLVELRVQGAVELHELNEI